jgi:hypothetical protein
MLLPNPWFVLVGVLAIGSVATGAYVKGGNDRENAIIAQDAKNEVLAQRMGDKMLSVAAKAISEIPVKNVYNKQVLEKEITRVPDYTACHASADGMRAVNDALANHGKPADSSGVPGNTPTPD